MRLTPPPTPHGWRPRPQVALQDLQTNSKISALLPYFVYVVSGVSSGNGVQGGVGSLSLYGWGGKLHAEPIPGAGR